MAERLDIAPFDAATAGEDELADYFRMRVAAAVVDRPTDPPLTLESVVGRLRTPMAGEGPRRCWVARCDGRLAGFAQVALPERENTHQGRTDILVHPDLRRRGIGTALLRTVLPALREHGRTVLEGWVIEGTSGQPWGRALGIPVVHSATHLLLVPEDADPARWAVDTPRGYRLARWAGTAPDDLLASYAHARSAIHDAPVGGSSDRPPEWTAELVRRSEGELRENDVDHRVVVAVHEGSGAVAGFTELACYPYRPEVGYQWDTAVLAEHRGHGLGRWVKSAMLRWLRAERPDIERIYTVNASDNVHMIGVNLQIGFTAFRTILQLEQDAAELEARLATR